MEPAYRLILTLVQSKRNKGEEDVDYATFEQDFITVDEKDELMAKKNRMNARGLTAAFPMIPNLQPKLMLLNLIKYYRILLFVRYTSSSFFYFFLLDHHSYEQPECQKRGLCFCKFLSFYNINKWNICGW
jgi:hypothetical protein